MQAVQVIVYPVQFIFNKCRACINWLLSAWRSMFNTRPRSQRTRLNHNRPVPTNTEDLPRGIPLKRPASAQKVVRKNYYRPAVIPLKWYKVASKPEETSPKITEQAPQVPENEMGSKAPKYEGRKKLQKPVGYRSTNSSTMREDDNTKCGPKLVSKETKRTPFANKRWSY